MGNSPVRRPRFVKSTCVTISIAPMRDQATQTLAQAVRDVGTQAPDLDGALASSPEIRSPSMMDYTEDLEDGRVTSIVYDEPITRATYRAVRPVGLNITSGDRRPLRNVGTIRKSKKPSDAYGRYVMSRLKSEDFKGLPLTAVAKAAGEEWRKMPVEEKEFWEKVSQKAEEERLNRKK